MSDGLNTADLAWLAGLLEGEGSFHLRDAKDSPLPKYPRVAISMTDQDVMARSAALVGANLLGPYVPKSSTHMGTKPVYRWYVNGKRAVDLMWQLLPFMGDRRRAQIEEIIHV